MVLSANEFEVFHVLDESLRPDWFFRRWTCKEAILKATGEGLSASLQQINLSDGPGSSLIYDNHTNATPWSLFVLNCLPGYAGAVAIKRGNAQLK